MQHAFSREAGVADLHDRHVAGDVEGASGLRGDVGRSPIEPVAVLAGQSLGEGAEGSAVAFTEGVKIVEPRIGLCDRFGHLQEVLSPQRLTALQRVQRRAEHPVGFGTQRVGNEDALVRRFQRAVLEVSRGVGPEVAWTVFRQVLKNTPMNLSKVSNVKLAPDRV